MSKKFLVSTGGVFGAAFLWLISFKIVAVWLGPAGVGIYGQMRQLIQAAGLAASLGGTNSIVQGISEREHEGDKLKFRSTVSKIVVLTSAILGGTIFSNAEVIALMLFASDSELYIGAVKLVSLVVFFYAGSIYLMGVLNAYERYGALAGVQIAGPFVLVAVLASMTHAKIEFNPWLLAASFTACFCTMFAVAVCCIFMPSRQGLQKAGNAGLSRNEVLGFLRFAGSTLASTLMGTISLLVIRAWVIESKGMEGAGLFDASWTITFNYLTLFLTACSAIYLPRLASSKSNFDSSKLITKTAYAVLGAVTVVSYFIYLFKVEFITLLYSKEFLASTPLLNVLLAAMVMRSASWVYSMTIIAAKDAKMMLISEALFNGSLIIAAKMATSYFHSLESLGWGFVVANFLYLILIATYAKRHNSILNVNYTVALILFATAPLIILSLLQVFSINSAPVNSIYAAMALVLCAVTVGFFSFVGFRRQDG